jgi:hypothetical protein
MDQSRPSAFSGTQVADEAWIAKYRAAIDASPPQSSESFLSKIAVAFKIRASARVASLVQVVLRLISGTQFPGKTVRKGLRQTPPAASEQASPHGRPMIAG